MNKVILIGRLVRDPEIRVTPGDQGTRIARYTLAVDRRFKKEGQQEADFIGCVAFGKLADIADKWYKKGTKISIVGRIQTGNYTKPDGTKVYTTDVVIEEQEFAESRKEAEAAQTQAQPAQVDAEGFMSIPEGIDDELPFSD